MKNVFENLGLNEKEMRIFLKMLELGAQPISIIAKYTNTRRTSMYAILERLKSTGLVEEFERNNIRYVKCREIRNVKDILTNKEHDIKKALETFEKELPGLQALEDRLSITPKIRFFEGERGIAKIYENALKEKSFYTFFNPEDAKRIVPTYYAKIPKLIKRSKAKSREIVTNCAEAKKYQKENHSEIHRIKILPASKLFNADVIISKNKIYMISYKEDQISGVEISSEPLTQALRVIFEQAWNNLEF